MLKLIFFLFFASVSFCAKVTGYHVIADQVLIPQIRFIQHKFIANIGKNFTRNLLLDDVHRFQDLGTVKMVRFGKRKYKSGIQLLYKIEAFPPVRNFIINSSIDFKFRRGPAFSFKTLFEDLNKISVMYLNKDIMYVDTISYKDISFSNSDVRIKLTEYRFRDLIIKGASGENARIIRENFRLHKGSLVYRSKLLASLCDIYSLPFVKDVDWIAHFGSDKVDIILTVVLR